LIARHNPERGIMSKLMAQGSPVPRLGLESTKWRHDDTVERGIEISFVAPMPEVSAGRLYEPAGSVVPYLVAISCAVCDMVGVTPDVPAC
jgi:hypothetical protein